MINALLAPLLFLWPLVPASGAPQAPDASRAAMANPTLEQVEERVLADSPRIKASRSYASAARSRALASAAWPDPGLGVTYDGLPRPGLDLDAAGQTSLDITQQVPFPGKTLLAWRAARAGAARAEAESMLVVRQELFTARQAWWDFVVAVGTVRFLDRARETLDKVVALSSKRNRFGQVGRMEQLMEPMARMEEAVLESYAIELRQDRLEAAAMLNESMGAEPSAALGDPAPPEVPDTRTLEASPWLEGGLDSSPDVAVAKRDFERLKALRDRTRAEWLPDFMLQYSAGEASDGTKTGMAMAKMSVPWAWFWKPAADNRAATDELHASEADLDRARLTVRRMAAVEVSRLAAARERLALFDSRILPEADRALDLAVSGYQSGSVGSADVLTAVRMFVAMNTQRLMLVAEIGRSKAVLERYRGGERREK